jgi:hypothetical protein
MYINRIGAERAHQLASIVLGRLTVEWSERNHGVEISAHRVKDFNTDAHHNWTITISPEELAAIFHVASGFIGTPRAAEIAATFAPSLTAILRIATEISESPSRSGGVEGTATVAS